MPSVEARNASEATDRADELLLDHHVDSTSRSNAVQEAMPFGGRAVSRAAGGVLYPSSGVAENGPGNGPIGLNHRFSEGSKCLLLE